MIYLSNRFCLALFTFLVAILVFSSCGARRKGSYGGRTTSGTAAKGAVLTDASDARGKTFDGTKLDNYAAILGVSARDLKNRALYNFIDSWMGSPHRLGGSEKSGIDCSGFVGILYREVYGKNLARSSRDMGEQVKRLYEKDLTEGDLVFFSFGGRTIDHVGVYLHNNKFVHVSTRRGVIISDIRDSWYYKYFVRCGTPKI
ncbi:lipoprotein Spr [Sphingobacterium allocomposti]|uniref:Lipoprotein Spr n=1 Tax=Sphingobacterium allocomposti TaxID=415956 RepID=A0A5S5DLA7_9SPHI|nr:NlpC/P60 family protein [Sphingobacterium composti Yoo et al. 2007 non Ten et al. 2007]TYP96138.1 lipoprotein Spr [Sphingobacterium composti Yoo et al. 2007 non Ten et al. 2007]